MQGDWEISVSVDAAPDSDTGDAVVVSLHLQVPAEAVGDVVSVHLEDPAPAFGGAEAMSPVDRVRADLAAANNRAANSYVFNLAEAQNKVAGGMVLSTLELQALEAHHTELQEHHAELLDSEAAGDVDLLPPARLSPDTSSLPAISGHVDGLVLACDMPSQEADGKQRGKKPKETEIGASHSKIDRPKSKTQSQATHTCTARPPSPSRNPHRTPAL